MFPEYRRQRPEVEKLEESNVTGLQRFSMGRRQDVSKEETWRTEN